MKQTARKPSRRALLGKSVRCKSDFALYCPVSVFEDAAKSGVGQSQRIAGIITTDELDSEGERVLQDGLDYSYLLGARGFFNNDHGSSHHDLLGVPETVTRYNKGDILPNGQEAKANCTWCEGYLLDTEQGRKTYEIARSLQDSNRRLGFSIEGTIDRRQGAGGKVIGKARIRHVAITHQPVNQGTTLEALVRSISQARVRRPKHAAKGMEVSGDGQAKKLVRQHLSRQIANLAGPSGNKKAKKVRSRINRLKSVYKALPHASVEYAVWLAQHLEHSK